MVSLSSNLVREVLQIVSMSTALRQYIFVGSPLHLIKRQVVGLTFTTYLDHFINLRDG